MDALSPATELRQLLGSGDLRAAGEWLVSRYAADVVSFCRSMVRERVVAEDLAQDVFSNAFSNLRGYRADAAPRTWLLAIARNRCIDHLRRCQREPWLPGGDEGNEPDHYADDAPLPAELLLRRTDVEAALSELVEGERALIVLRFRHGLEYPELATVFGLREGTVRMRLSRALAKMRGRLEELDALPLAAPSPEAYAGSEGAYDRLESAYDSFVESDLDAESERPAAAAARPKPPPAPGAAPPPPARGAAPPPPASRAAAPPSGLGGAPPPLRESAKGRGLLGRARRWLAGESPPPATTVFAAALTPAEPDVSETLRDELARLVAALPS